MTDVYSTVFLTRNFGCVRLDFAEVALRGVKRWIFEAGGIHIIPFVGFNPCIASISDEIGFFTDSSLPTYDFVVEEAKQIFPSVAVELKSFSLSEVVACFPWREWPVAWEYSQMKIGDHVPIQLKSATDRTLSSLVRKRFPFTFDRNYAGILTQEGKKRA